MSMRLIVRYVPVDMAGRGSERCSLALRVQYEGSCLTGFCKWCVGGVNGKLD
jgi:hypothetical protein